MENRGRYIYGVAVGEKVVYLGAVGIASSRVYTIPAAGFCAIVHSCPAQPYRSTDEDTVKRWVSQHQGVLDEAKRQLGAVIPMGFDTILQSKDDAVSANEVVKEWLKRDSERLRRMMERVKSKDEYGVQVFYTPAAIAKQLLEADREIRRIAEETAGKPPGAAYLYRQKLERAIKAEVERLANEWFKDFYARVRRHCDDIIVEKTGKTQGNRVMLLNLSCLVATDKAGSLGEELDGINKLQGFSVRFTGPWHPYSFAAKPIAPVGEPVR